MLKQLIPAIRMLLVLTCITGLAYPLAVTAVAHVAFPSQAGGSLLWKDGQVVGSSLVGQAMDEDRYFWPRPSAVGYDPLPSGGSNLGPTSDQLGRVRASRAEALRQANGLSDEASLPADLLDASASGLDPDISPAAALLQTDRIARAREYDSGQRQRLVELVERMITLPQFGLLGEPRVNVLQLNLALDALR
jgi:potassium-transporting ATPase KdpC subunit